MHVAVVFGGPSVEHDVSIITGQQVLAILGERHDVVPIYVAKDGRWWTGESLLTIQAFASDPPAGARPIELRLGSPTPLVAPSSGRFKRDEPLRVDVVVNAIHGTGGEDGSLLGALELAGLPYVGRGVAASAVAMDKHLAKVVLRDAGLEVLPHARFERDAWEQDPDAVQRAAREQGADVIVKPATLGSSVGVGRARTDEELQDALELAFELDRQVIVEPFAAGAQEMNVAVLGRPGGEYVVSEVEQPLGGDDGLSFDDKYLRGGKGAGGKAGGAKGAAATGGTKAAGDGKSSGMAGQDRLIPAPIEPELRDRLRAAAEQAHRALRIAGVTRYDFFVLEDGRILLNEPNTVPGSFAFYLFEHVGIAFPELLERLVGIAVAEAQEERSTTRYFASALIDMHLGRA
jgi:D-alanine-D-alanine ligase